MLSGVEQSIESGNGNTQVSGNLYIKQVNQYFGDYHPKVTRFYEDDICMVLEEFNKYIETIENEVDENNTLNTELEYVEKPEKNKLNNLSEQYFQIILDEYLPYFKKIDTFLKAPQNKKYLRKYRATAQELKFKIEVERKHYEYFENILDSILQGVLSSNKESIIENRDVFIVFLNYMYWNCDIGRRENIVIAE